MLYQFIVTSQSDLLFAPWETVSTYVREFSQAAVNVQHLFVHK